MPPNIITIQEVGKEGGGDRGVMAKEDINSANGCNGVGMCDKNAEVLKA